MSHPTLGSVRRRQQNRGAARRRSVRDQHGPPGRLYLGQPIDFLRVAFPCRALRLSNAFATSCCPTLMRPIPLRAISPGTRTSPRIWSRTPSCGPCAALAATAGSMRRPGCSRLFATSAAAAPQRGAQAEPLLLMHGLLDGELDAANALTCEE